MRLQYILRSLRPRLARPKTFLGFVPLQMGTEIISAILFFNKLTGAYGLLAILTGFSLSAMQLSAYLYNLAILILLVICIPHIRRETPLPNLALAWAYTVDTLINAAYTATFAVSWYFASSSAAASAVASSTVLAAATATTTATATATTSVAAAATATATAATTTLAAASATASATVSSVLVAAASSAVAGVSAAPLLARRGDAAGTAVLTDELATSAQANGATSTPAPTFGGGGWMSVHETTASLALIVVVTVVRFYFCLIVIAHTRQALQRYGDHVAESAAAADGALSDDDDNDNDLEDNDASSGGASGSGGGGSGNASGNESHNKGSSRSEGKSRRPGGGTTNLDDEEAGRASGTRLSRPGRHQRRRQHQHRPRLARPARPSSHLYSSSTSSNDPFALGSPAGEGWKGKLGRTLLNAGGRGFWLGRQKDDDWARDINARFRSAGP